MLKLVGLVGFGAMLGIGLINSASAAQTLQSNAVELLDNGQSVSVMSGGVTIAFSGFNLSCNNGGASCYDLFMVPSSGPEPGVIIEAANGTTPGVSLLEPILSFACSAGTCNAGGNYDVTLDGDLSATAGKTPITGASLAVGGTAIPNSLLSETGQGTETVQTGHPPNPTTLCTMNGPSGSCSFAPESSVFVTKDLGFDNVSLTAGQSLQMYTITENFSVPEPASLASFLMAIIALGAVRNRRHRA